MAGHIKAAVSFAFVWLCMYGGYAYALYIGSWFIQKQVNNDIYDEPYTAGDCLTIFFGIMFGLFTFGAIEPQIKAIVAGKVAGKFTYETIDRTPLIPILNPSGNKCQNLRGQIELKDV